ncbi:hypothetical protein SAY86_030999 [Trapa natans]|uniref:Uncharacterized protein n=1 Tax=Trapa natans TaxID=22666 RepID=A0AAN7LYP6_TRANT|nr:hypothetical protein SAY86_030999 [Trapa natans]
MDGGDKAESSTFLWDFWICYLSTIIDTTWDSCHPGNYNGNLFITKQNGIWKATPLLLAVAVIELGDIAFVVSGLAKLIHFPGFHETT